MSRYTRTRTADYYNSLLTGNDDDFHKLLKRYAICPPNNATGTAHTVGSTSLGHIDTGAGAANAVLAGSTNTLGIEMMKMAGLSKIGHIQLYKEARQGAGADAIGDAIRFRVSAAAQAGYDPVYFLPWQDNTSIRLSIKPVTTANPTDPSLFFTAAINGCSIYFKGTADAPVIYHCGGNTGYGGNIANAVAFWDEVMDEFKTEEVMAGSAKGAMDVVEKVDKSHYVTAAGVTATSKFSTGVKSVMPTTKRAKRYGALLKAKHALGKLDIEDVKPWGCVLGRRDPLTHLWTFYLQENATVTYHQISLNPVKRSHGVKTSSFSVARPMIYREIFPRGSGHATLVAGLPTIR